MEAWQFMHVGSSSAAGRPGVLQQLTDGAARLEDQLSQLRAQHMAAAAECCGDNFASHVSSHSASWDEGDAASTWGGDDDGSPMHVAVVQGVAAAHCGAHAQAVSLPAGYGTHPWDTAITDMLQRALAAAVQKAGGGSPACSSVGASSCATAVPVCQAGASSSGIRLDIEAAINSALQDCLFGGPPAVGGVAA
jgi:hypothetical protein